MADNVQTQSATLATPPALTRIGTAEAAFSGETVQFGLSGLVELVGAEGARVATIVVPALATAKSCAVTRVNASGSSVSLLAANAVRRGATFFNDSTATAYVKCGATASTTSFSYKLFGGQTLELPLPCTPDAIDAIWESATGAMQITETI